MYKKILFIDTDKLYSDYLVSKLKFLKNIHPNIITFFGIFLNVLIYYSLDLKLLLPLLFLLFLRYLTDCLDGAVARMYKKVSKLGGYLDTISDHMLIFIVSFFFFGVFCVSFLVIFNHLFTLL